MTSRILKMAASPMTHWHWNVLTNYFVKYGIVVSIYSTITLEIVTHILWDAKYDIINYLQDKQSLDMTVYNLCNDDYVMCSSPCPLVN